jgi:hypothetical protein
MWIVRGPKSHQRSARAVRRGRKFRGFEELAAALNPWLLVVALGLCVLEATAHTP